MQVYGTESGKNETKCIGDLLLWDVTLNFDSTTGNNAKNTRALYEGQITKNKSTTRTSTIHAQSQAATVTMNADSTTGNNAKNTRALYEGQVTKNKSTTRTSTIHAQSHAATVTMNAGTDAQESGSDQTNF
ncbi:hypothetical protein T08_9676 [Trichinella sp. T8]|nr:hypothetical protein T08_9676 [Trichinella sp. T8]